MKEQQKFNADKRNTRPCGESRLKVTFLALSVTGLRGGVVKVKLILRRPIGQTRERSEVQE